MRKKTREPSLHLHQLDLIAESIFDFKSADDTQNTCNKDIKEASGTMPGAFLFA